MADLSAEERAALDALLPPERQTGVLRDDLVSAARESRRIRIENSARGGAVLAALHRDTKSWATIEWATGIPATTARRWANPPPLTPEHDEPEPQQ